MHCSHSVTDGRKGIRLKFLNWKRAEYGNMKSARNILGGSGKSCLFFLTCFETLESIHTAIGLLYRKGVSLSEAFRAPSRILETLAREFASLRSVLITASGLLGE